MGQIYQKQDLLFNKREKYTERERERDRERERGRRRRRRREREKEREREEEEEGERERKKEREREREREEGLLHPLPSYSSSSPSILFSLLSTVEARVLYDSFDP